MRDREWIENEREGEHEDASFVLCVWVCLRACADARLYASSAFVISAIVAVWSVACICICGMCTDTRKEA